MLNTCDFLCYLNLNPKCREADPVHEFGLIATIITTLILMLYNISVNSVAVILS